MYLFGGRARRIVAPFGRGEMRRFIVCCLFAAKTAEIKDRTVADRSRDSVAQLFAACLGLADNLKPCRD
jgi:hypothetical protein